MTIDDVLVLRGADVRAVLQDRKAEIIEAVKGAYCDHNAGRSFLPHSVFVRFPGREKERIIALPAYLGGAEETAGIKWISSFPGNLERGMSRASAILVLNDLSTGRPQAVLEGSVISAARTAASAALAADVLHPKGDIDVFGIIGCGLINREIAAYVAALGRRIRQILVYDIDPDRARRYGESLSSALRHVPVDPTTSAESVLRSASLVSFATTAVKPTISDLSMCPAGTTILHISLRDLTAEAILQSDNVVDDVDHVLRAETSVHLAERKLGNRSFVRCTLADVIVGTQPPRRNGAGTVVFSPFGLGVLDLAVGRLALKHALAERRGAIVDGFFADT
jgi:2,3-diaminopropionate biosynthesis protein SbnB